jgi:hypothetical protein
MVPRAQIGRIRNYDVIAYGQICETSEHPPDGPFERHAGPLGSFRDIDSGPDRDRQSRVPAERVSATGSITILQTGELWDAPSRGTRRFSCRFPGREVRFERS